MQSVDAWFLPCAQKARLQAAVRAVLGRCTCVVKRTRVEGSSLVTAETCGKGECPIASQAAVSSALGPFYLSRQPVPILCCGPDGSYLFSALGHMVTPSTVGKPCTELSSAQVTTPNMSVKCCSPWRGQKVGPSPLLSAFGLEYGPLASRLQWKHVVCKDRLVACRRSEPSCSSLQSQEGLSDRAFPCSQVTATLLASSVSTTTRSPTTARWGS